MGFPARGEVPRKPGLDSVDVSNADRRARKRENKEAARAEREAAIRRERRRRGTVRAIVALAVFAAAITALSLTRGDEKSGGKKTDKSYTATITTNYGVIKVALDNEHAPKATARFVSLAEDGFYNGLTWHRAAKDFVIQGGDPNGDGSGGTGTTVAGEVPTDHYPIGSLAAAKTGADPAGTFDSQFFIVTGSGGETLPNDYARFGMVTEGLDVAQKIEALAPASGDGPPTKPATIDKIEITES